MDKRIELETQRNRTRERDQGTQNEDITGNKKDKYQAGCVVVVGS